MPGHRITTAGLVAVVAASACTDVELYIPELLAGSLQDNRLRVRTQFCAAGAEEVRSYLKVMFVVDKSDSMNVTDPANQRVRAAQDVVLRLMEDTTTHRLRPGVEVAVIGFHGTVETLTSDERGLPGFSADGTAALFALTGLARTGRNTGYSEALAVAFQLLDRDMAQLEDAARSRSRYEIIFVSDGMPYPDNCRGESNSPSSAVEGVRRIVGLERVYDVSISLHTAFASLPAMFAQADDVDACASPDRYEQDYDSLGEETRALLRDMAAAGGGNFWQFESSDSISFAQLELAESRRIYALASFLADNVNARPGAQPGADTDGDGLEDEQEWLLGSDIALADTDGDGFSDGLEWQLRLSGFDLLDPTDARCPDAANADTDGDGLRDCEELFLRSNQRRFDSDADGLPDAVEIRHGTDPGSPTPLYDRLADSDGDGGTDAEELRWHTDPLVEDAASRARTVYQYVQTEWPPTSGRACYDLEIANVAMASTGATAHTKAGTNRVMLYFGQTPYDDPLGEPLYSVACAEGRFVAERELKMPAAGVITIPLSRPSDTYRPAPVLRPASAACHASVDQDCGPNTLQCRFEADGACVCWTPDGTPAGACPACANGIDDDGDGATDHPFDPDCFDSADDDEAPGAACGNGVDDDGDGTVDFPHDPGCESSLDDDEANPVTAPACANGIDDDEDGAVDYPADPHCYAAVDNTEAMIATTAYACSDGLDNDGDGRVDLADPGCSALNDMDEAGPAVCFFCERLADAKPGQCELGTGFCKPLAGAPEAGPCTSRRDCRGAPCVGGLCLPCMGDRDCDSAPAAGDGVCDGRRGWCLDAVYTPAACIGDSECPGRCHTDLGVCAVDPHVACRNAHDCAPGQFCSEARGSCMAPAFHTGRCGADTDCAAGGCDGSLGWCVPQSEAHRCRHDDECARGSCTAGGYCEQPSAVEPRAFDPGLDCWRLP